MDYGGASEHLTQNLAEIIIDWIRNSFWDIGFFWDTVDDEIKCRITTTVNYYLPGNTTDNPLYRTASLSAMAQAIGNIHVMLGGLETAYDDCLKVTENAIDFFFDDRADFGYVTPISEDRWMLAQDPLRIYGTGRHWIYLYYYEHERAKTEHQFKSIPGAHVAYPCNIGRTDKRKPEERVYQETNSPPTIGLLIRVDDEINFEKVIHSILKLWGKHIPPKDRDGEQEWFNTTPEEVHEIYEKISKW